MNTALLVGFIIGLGLLALYLDRMTSAILDALKSVLAQNQRSDELRVGEHNVLLLRSLADKWDSVEEKPNILELRRRWHDDGPSVPSLWLREQADLLEEGLNK